MKTFAYTIQDELGIHIRPAGELVKESAKFQSASTLTANGRSADMKRLFAVMSLAVKHGESVTVTVEGPDEEAAADALLAFFRAKL